MKKIIAAVLLAVMALSLFSCAKPELYELDSAFVSAVQAVKAPNVDIDKDEFIEAYSTAKVKGVAGEDDKTGNDVIVVTLANDKGVVTIYSLGKNKFCVTGTNVEKDYIMESKELYEFYMNIVDPQPEFVKIEGKYEASLVKKPEAEIDTAALVQYYNNSKLTAKAKDEKSDDTIVIICDDGKASFSLSYLGDNLFRVSGSEIKVDYIIKSKGLADLYTKAVK